MKNFLMITGAGGFVGNNLINYFSKKKFKIYAYYNSKIEKNFKKNIIYVKKNLKNLKKINNNVGTIIHCAAQTPPSVDQKKCYSNNLRIDENLINLVKKSKVKRIIFLSSMSVYGRNKKKIINEDSKPAQLDLYGKAKLITEGRLKELAFKYKKKVLIIRLPSVIGYKCHSTFLCRLGENIFAKEIHMYNYNSQFNACLHVSNLCSIIYSILKKESFSFDILNLFSLNPLKVRSIFKLFKKELNPSIKIIPVKSSKKSYLVKSINIKKYRFNLNSTLLNLKLYIRDLKFRKNIIQNR